MLKKLLVTTAITTLMIGAAAAQGNPPTSRSNEAPAVTTPPPAATTPPPAATAPPAAKSTEMSKPSTEMSKPAATASSAKFINSQRSDQMLASKFKGTDVLGTDDQKIGDVSDILFEKDGKILAYVVSVGGFLGLGTKDVALEPSAFQIVAGDKSKNESDKLKLAMSKDELKQAAAFEPYKAPSSTTGMGSPGTTRPAGSRPAQ
jgi:sporulation protein YlmC with PRC-barrel domain